MSYVVLPSEPLDQGDIIRSVHLIRKAPGQQDIEPEIVVAHVVVLSRGCEIDKPDRPPVRADMVHVAALSRLDILTLGQQGDVRAFRILNTFYLPMEAGIMPVECFIDWRTVQPVDKNTLLAARSGERYICTLDEQTRDAALATFYEFLTRS